MGIHAIDVTKRFSHGLQFQGGYVYGVALASNRYSFRTPYRESLDTGDEGGITHAFKGNWVYELPFGSGRKFLGNSGGFVDRLVAGWSFDGVARITTGRLLDFGDKVGYWPFAGCGRCDRGGVLDPCHPQRHRAADAQPR